MTEEERIKIYLENKQKNKEEEARKAEKKRIEAQNFKDMKLSHDWESVMVYKKNYTSGYRQIENCKKCGEHYILFKVRPSYCSK